MYLTPNDKALQPESFSKKAFPRTAGGVSVEKPKKSTPKKKKKWDGVMGVDWQLVNGGEIDREKHSYAYLKAKQDRTTNQAADQN